MKSKYFFAFLLALTLHLSIIALFVLSIPIDTSDATKNKQQPVIIEATILDEHVVTAKAQQLKQQRLQAEKKKQQQIKKQRTEEKRRKVEATRLAEEKRKQAKAKQEATRREAEKQKKIATEKRQKMLAEKLRLEVARQVEQNRIRAEEEKRRQVEATRLAEEKRKQAKAKQEAARREAEKQKKIATEKRQKALADATARIKRKITQNWNRPGLVPVNLKCKIGIELIASGDVVSVVITTSSGNSLFDESAVRAVRKASPLPVPKDPNVFNEFRSFSLEFSPDK